MMFSGDTPLSMVVEGVKKREAKPMRQSMGCSAAVISCFLVDRRFPYGYCGSLDCTKLYVP
jgi:hypothetical protein